MPSLPQEHKPAIVLRNVSVRRNQELALINLRCEIPEQSLTIVFGPNGAGKTTLLQLLIGELTPEQGEVLIYGAPPSSQKKCVGYVPQLFTVRRDFPLTVFDAVLMGLYQLTGPFGAITAEHTDRVTRQLERLGIESIARCMVSEISGGQLQRVMIARALVAAPRILLLDEASSGIDIGAKESLFDLLTVLKREMTVVFVTHDISVVSQDVDCILCLNKELVSHGPPAVALSDEAIRCMYGEDQALFSHCRTPHIHVTEHSS